MFDIFVKIPNNNIEERTYVINTLFGCFLHLKISNITASETEFTEISFNEKTILIEDHFWNLHKEPLSYLNSLYLPEPQYFKNQFCVENDIPVIYGTDDFVITSDSITCGIDIFASAFFMLARWEEYCNPKCDEHGRFLAEDSIALKYNFLHRPVANEYAEMLWNMMKYLGFDGQRQVFNFQPIITHDVDVLQSKNRLVSAVGDVLFRRNFALAKSRFATRKDPIDTFDFLMTQSEKIGQKSTFFLMTSDYRQGKNSNYLKTKRFAELVKEISARGHKIGLHAGFETFNNCSVYKHELEKLEEATNCKITASRQHFLKVQVPTTLQILETCGISTDYTLGYSDHEGFRCGTGNEYPVFDFLKRKALKINELPLIIMDATLKNQRNFSPEVAQNTILQYFDLGRKYHMPIAILFHNSSFDDYFWKGWKQLYINIIHNLTK